ncbi:hypothetical protein [Mesobacillus foraminis]|uniref:HNH endonuclease n=1 Tax=Mesobacillus foraminis TaxID=279826 RepID=A0A4R2BGJ6_9BACI|nr:hypothetical protein [Mesobacillus foraminis]TCN25502.1 hypothetical protein EV146_105159 [Mesobacillus foraminis]
MGRKRLQPNVFVIDTTNHLVYIHLSGRHGMGKIALTDMRSFRKHNISAHTWRCTKDFYVYTVIEGKMEFLHRVVSGNKDPEMHTDHINGSEGEKTLDNRFSNLRICTNQENQMNSKVRADNKTGYKNVNELNGKYRCMIRIDKKKQYFGSFNSPEEAAYCYNIVIPRLSDVYQLNDIPEDSLTEEQMELVHNTVVQRFNKINSKYQLIVHNKFNKWTEKVKRESI